LLTNIAEQQRLPVTDFHPHRSPQPGGHCHRLEGPLETSSSSAEVLATQEPQRARQAGTRAVS
jgi:hypothetical protein